MKKLLAAAALACVFAVPAHATPLFFDNFNSNPDAVPGAPAGWTVTAPGSVDVIGNGFNWYPGNGKYVDLDGSDGANGQNVFMISNTVANYIGGVTYNWSFDYGINQNDGSDTDSIIMGIFDATNNVYQDLFTVDANALPHTGTFSNVFTAFAALGMANYNFAGQVYFKGISVGDVDQSGGLIDNVKVSAVPLPGAALFLLTGLAGLGGLARMRRKA